MSKSTNNRSNSPYDEFSRQDETYPCPRCEIKTNPRRCAKQCSKHKLWTAIDWINMQYNARIIRKAERDERIHNAIQKYSQGDDTDGTHSSVCDWHR